MSVSATFAEPYVRARLAQPKERYLFERFHTPCTAVRPILFALAQTFAQPIDFIHYGCFMLSVPHFRVQSRLTITISLAQNLCTALE